MRIATHICILVAGLLHICSIAHSQTEVQVYTLAEIDSVWNNYLYLQYSMKILPHTTDSITHSPLYRLVFQEMKEWSETTDLSWDNFIPVNTNEIGSNSTIKIQESVSFRLLKYRNTDYSYKDLTVSMIPGRSYYDPAKADDWDLRYNKVLFDIAELSAREAVKAYNSSQDTTKGDINEYYERIFEERKQTFNRESNQGKDTTVISDYESGIRRELKENPREYTPQEFGYTPIKKTNLEMGAHMGYLNSSIIGNGSEFLKSANGMTFGFEVGYHGFKFEGELYILGYGKLKQSDFYHDYDNDYDWVKGETVQEAGIRFKTGYTLFSNEYVRFTPVIGTSLGSLTQLTDKKQKDGKHNIDSKLPGNQGFLFGLDTDWIIWRDQDNNGISFNGLRFSVYGMYHNYKKNLGDVWSLNLGISLLAGY